MELTTEQLADGIERIALNGRLDVAGTGAIDLRLASLTATRPALIIIDLSQVSFLASIGIRTLLTNAKSVARRGGRMVLAGPQPLVADVLRLGGIDGFIPVYPDVASACEGLKSAAGSR